MSAPAATAAKLWLGIYLPLLPLEALSRAGELRGPVVVVIDQHHSARVITANEAARKRGVQPGMVVSGALALAPSLRVLKRDEVVEVAALEGLAAWASQFTSLVSLVAAQGLLLEVRGSLRLFGGIDALQVQIREGLQALGYTACMAITPTPLGAWWLAQLDTSRPVVMDRATLVTHLAPVPLALMALPSPVAAMAQGMGLKCFGDCYRLHRGGLARRLGPELVRLLDRAVGLRPDPRNAYTVPRVFDRCLLLSASVWDVEALIFAVRRLLMELVGFLQARSEGVLGLDIILVHAKSDHTCIALQLSGVTRDLPHLLELLRARLERIKLSAAVESVRCKARCTLPLDTSTSGSALFDTINVPEEQKWSLVERLRVRLGAAAVQGLCAVAEHRPERAWRYAVLEKPQPAPRVSLPRPLWLLEEPRILKAVNDRLYLGGTLELTSGPECIESGWWDGEDVVRDYFVARNPGGARFWIFRERDHPKRWFLHGLFG